MKLNIEIINIEIARLKIKKEPGAIWANDDGHPGLL